MAILTTTSYVPPYARKEELANIWSHAIGAVFSLCAIVLMLATTLSQGDIWKVTSAAIYGLCLFTLFLASSLYHYAREPQRKARLKTFDHCAIFLLIAGTYTPFLILALAAELSWILLGVIWTLAIIGIVGKLFWAQPFKKISLLFYLAMGWLIVFAGEELFANLNEGALNWLIAGGIIYTLGAIFYACKRIPYNHAIWHVFVLAASVCHFISISVYLLPI